MCAEQTKVSDWPMVGLYGESMTAVLMCFWAEEMYSPTPQSLDEMPKI